MAVYYNEFDPKAAKWLEQLMKKGMIPKGDVDTRSITEVQADDLRGYTQCHFFAGIGGWSRALELAMWPDSRPVWTGSCPCQPFSSAGKREGQADDRHLWPSWFRLIKECRPITIFGEQVASAIAFGWLDEVAVCLEEEGYAFGQAVLPACAAGAFHIRSRLWFVAHRYDAERSGTMDDTALEGELREAGNIPGESEGQDGGLPIGIVGAGGVGNSEHNGSPRAALSGGHEAHAREGASQEPICTIEPSGAGSHGDVSCDVAYIAGEGLPQRHGKECGESSEVKQSERLCAMGDTFQSRLEGQPRHEQGGEGWLDEDGSASEADTIDWVYCPDGKQRPIKPSIRLLADGFPARVGLLRGFGNAIHPPTAAKFIEATKGII